MGGEVVFKANSPLISRPLGLAVVIGWPVTVVLLLAVLVLLRPDPAARAQLLGAWALCGLALTVIGLLPGRLVIDRSGVTHRWLLWSRRVEFERVIGIEHRDQGIELRCAGGEVVRVRMALGKGDVWAEQRQRAYEAVREAYEGAKAGRGALG